MFQEVLKTMDDLVWGLPLIIMILAVGIFFTIQLKGVQITQLPRAIRLMLKSEADGEKGEVSSFGALCTALSATIGTGNIVGVGTAIYLGGPGAVLWCWLTGCRWSRSLVLDVDSRLVWNCNQVCRVSSGSEVSQGGKGWPYRGWPLLLHRKWNGTRLEMAW